MLMSCARILRTMVKYATIEFFQQLADALNADPNFQAKAGSVKATLLFSTKERAEACLMKVEQGKVNVTEVPRESPADFTFWTDYATWITNHRDNVPLEKLIMTGKVKFKGSLPKIMMLKSQLNIIDDTQRKIPAEY